MSFRPELPVVLKLENRPTGEVVLSANQEQVGSGVIKTSFATIGGPGPQFRLSAIMMAMRLRWLADRLDPPKPKERTLDAPRG